MEGVSQVGVAILLLIRAIEVRVRIRVRTRISNLRQRLIKKIKRKMVKSDGSLLSVRYCEQAV